MTPSAVLITSFSKVLLHYPHSLLDMPSLATVTLPHAFEDKNDVRIIGCHTSSFPSFVAVGSLEEYDFPPESYHKQSSCCTVYCLSFFKQTLLFRTCVLTQHTYSMKLLLHWTNNPKSTASEPDPHLAITRGRHNDCSLERHRNTQSSYGEPRWLQRACLRLTPRW